MTHSSSEYGDSIVWLVEQMPVDPNESENYREEIGGGGGGWIPPGPSEKKKSPKPAEQKKNESPKPKHRTTRPTK